MTQPNKSYYDEETLQLALTHLVEDQDRCSWLDLCIPLNRKNKEDLLRTVGIIPDTLLVATIDEAMKFKKGWFHQFYLFVHGLSYRDKLRLNILKPNISPDTPHTN